MPGLVPAIHVVPSLPNDVDGRDKPGHDDMETGERTTPMISCDRAACKGRGQLTGLRGGH
jgi:hypothetical protein